MKFGIANEPLPPPAVTEAHTFKAGVLLGLSVLATRPTHLAAAGAGVILTVPLYVAPWLAC